MASLSKPTFTERSSPVSQNHHPDGQMQSNDIHPVKGSKNTATTGLVGIIVYETENTFKIVTKEDELKGKSANLCCSPRPLNSCYIACLQSFQKGTPSLRSVSQSMHCLRQRSRHFRQARRELPPLRLLRKLPRRRWHPHWIPSHPWSLTCTETSSAFDPLIERRRNSSTRRRWSLHEKEFKLGERHILQS